MNAQVGDRLVVAGARVGDGDRVGVITDIRHEDGSPPYRVRWQDSDREVLIYPGPDARVVRPTHVDV